VNSSHAAAPQIEQALQLERAGRLTEAALTYVRLLELWPDLPDCWYNLGRLQRQLNLFEPALHSYAMALQKGIERPEEVHLNRGAILSDCLRDADAAERELRTALSLNARYLPALQNLANLEEDRGQREQALTLYERILELEPRAFESLARYVQLAAHKGQEPPLIARLHAALAAPNLSPGERASLLFALTRLLDATGDYAGAFAAAQAANQASRLQGGSGARYNRAAQERFTDELIRAFPARRIAETGQIAQGSPAQPDPIFICGMFRSGSTLTERVLAGGPGVTNGGELQILPNLAQNAIKPFPAGFVSVPDDQLAQLGARYRAGLAALFPGAAHVTDKWPENFLYIGFIKSILPEARIVHTIRDPLDTCLSIFFLHLDQRLSYALDLMDIGHYYRQYRRLMAHWRSLYGAEIFDFDYDALVREPRAAAQRLLAYCGLQWHEGVLDFAERPGSVKTASVWQVRENLYQSSSGRAQHYAAQLAELAASLKDV
jgi:tetratricopeptide (TPR) repeat protein